MESEKNNDEDSLEALESWEGSNPEDAQTGPQITSLNKIDDVLDPLTSPSTISTSTENVKIDESQLYEEEISSENGLSESQETDLEYEHESHIMNLTEGSTNISNDIHPEDNPTNEELLTITSQNSIPTIANEEEVENQSREHLTLISSNGSSLFDDLEDSTITVMPLLYETTSLSSFHVDEPDPVIPTNSTLLNTSLFVLHSSTPDTEIITTTTTFNDSDYSMTTEVTVEELPPVGEDLIDSDELSESSEESQLMESSDEAFPDSDYAPEVISKDDKHANSDTTLSTHSAEETMTASTPVSQVTEQNKLEGSDEYIKQAPPDTFSMTTISLLLLTEASSTIRTPSYQPSEPPKDQSSTQPNFLNNFTTISPPPNTGGVQRSDSSSIYLFFSLVFLLSVKYVE